LPFLATSALTGDYGIFTPEKLQDFYNIPQAQKRAKILSLARERLATNEHE
jgi:hypothetical protein